jgi:hypothetical protein
VSEKDRHIADREHLTLTFYAASVVSGRRCPRQKHASESDVLQGVADEPAWETFFGAAMPATAAGSNRTDAPILQRRNTIDGGELVELPLANPQKNGKFRDSKSLTFFLQNFNEVHGFTPCASAQQNVVVMESGQLWSRHHF